VINTPYTDNPAAWSRLACAVARIALEDYALARYHRCQTLDHQGYEDTAYVRIKTQRYNQDLPEDKRITERQYCHDYLKITPTEREVVGYVRSKLWAYSMTLDPDYTLAKVNALVERCLEEGRIPRIKILKDGIDDKEDEE
jgi:hypothetical protein